MNSFWTKKENDFWKEIIEEILDTLYHGENPEEINWVSEYPYEAENMVTDIKEFHESLTQAGIDTTNEVMANFLIYTEFMHINNVYCVIGTFLISFYSQN